MAFTVSWRSSARDGTARPARGEAALGRVYAWSGFAVMWVFWVSFVVFLANPKQVAGFWPLPTVDGGGFLAHPLAAASIDLALIGLFGLQHSLMARPWVKDWWASAIPEAFERCTFVHMANAALFALIVFWQPIPVAVWTVPGGWVHDAMWVLFALGWIILLAGAWSFGILDLLGIAQMRAWSRGKAHRSRRLKTGLLYKWLRHPMYVGVLLGVWATPRMTVGHLLLAAGLTLYVLIAMRYEERDLAQRFGASYVRWRGSRLVPRAKS
jgi:protein-S-isoprenylcysteine O-methyltransferase Ste14